MSDIINKLKTVEFMMKEYDSKIIELKEEHLKTQETV